ncbi:PEP-CTERM sorting domain-containing protein [Alienimonas sp. DA493]|uniref:PEP-CTERM sorting domain-containing protein n=1 Tax=Alienimonas sp. DA493 TaxID=3373605 RepID=UPI003754F119
MKRNFWIEGNHSRRASNLRAWFAAGAVLLLFSHADASAGLITFEFDTPGTKPNGFTSSESPQVSFFDTLGADLTVGNFGARSIGQGLAVPGDDASGLELVFSTMMSSLSLTFGNDDPFFVDSNDLALLTVFNGSTEVGQESVVVNRNTAGDQVVLFSGANFNRATFFFTDENEVPLNLAEVVDSIAFAEAAAVPEPGSLALILGAGAAGLCGARRRRRASYKSAA